MSPRHRATSARSHGGAAAGVTAANRSASCDGLVSSSDCDVGLDEVGSDAERLAHGPDTAVGGDASLQQRHGRRRVGATQGAECRRHRLVGREAGGPGPVGERPGTLERSVSVLVKTAGRRLPGQHLHGNGGVGRVAQLVPELGCLSGIGEGSGVVAEPRSPGREQCQRRHQDAERAAVPDLAQLI